MAFIHQLSGQCEFSISNNNPCGETPIVFSIDNPSGTYGWDFDGDTNVDAFGPTVTYTFPQTGNDASYTVNVYQNNMLCNSEEVIILASPDPLLGVVPGNAIIDDHLIRVCSATPEATLQLINLSTTLPIDQTYYVNWGDGVIDTFDVSEFDNNGFVEHQYQNYGYYSLSFTAIAGNGCESVENYTFYNGSNPSVGLANPGNTVGLCAPATINFPITNYLSNPQGTEYYIYVGGELVGSYTQNDVPAIFSYTFLETSCGLTTSTGNYQNAFDVQVEAVNPCGSSQATIEPIEVSEPPELEFETDTPEVGCIGDPITVTNTSADINEVISGNPSICESSISPSWTISPGVAGIDWTVISGNVFSAEELEIIFNLPGEYTVTMTINSPSCGPFHFSESFTIIEPPNAGADFELNSDIIPSLPDECAPTTGIFTNTSTGDSLSYIWQVSPSSGWNFANGGTPLDASVDINFLDPGSYSVALTTTNACASSVWDTSFVIAGPPAVTLDNLPGFCETGTLDINSAMVSYGANGGQISTYTWSFPGAVPESSNDAFPTNIFFPGPGQYDITIQVDNQCGSDIATQILTIEEPGTLVIDNDITVCESEDPFQLFSDPTGGFWTGQGVNLDGLFSPSQNTLGDNLVVYSLILGECELVDSLTVTVLPSPVVEAGPSQEACIDEEPFIITGGSPIGGNWQATNGGVIIGGDTFDPVASGVGVFTLIYSFTDSNGCYAEDTKTIIVHDLPSVDAGPNQTICENPNDIQLSGFTPTGGSWSGPGVTTNGVFNVTNTPGQGAYQLYYEFINPNTGCGNLDSLMITVVANDTAYASIDREVCLDAGLQVLNDGNPVGGTWSG
ncbi:MAG: hypothetical protein HKN16_10005, partial [Saprospiraceae bacterium]|nr:hypothetical protein [Saprospiraceae bacterium]